MNNDSQLLFVAFEEDIKVFAIDDACEELQVNGRTFRRDSDFDAHAYYDWLRSQTGTIIGLRLDLVEESQYLIEAIEHFDYVETENKRTYFRIIYLYFGKDRKFDPKLSDDQAFWDCYLYFGDANLFGLTFLLPDSKGQFALRNLPPS